MTLRALRVMIGMNIKLEDSLLEIKAMTQSYKIIFQQIKIYLKSINFLMKMQTIFKSIQMNLI